MTPKKSLPITETMWCEGCEEELPAYENFSFKDDERCTACKYME